MSRIFNFPIIDSLSCHLAVLLAAAACAIAVAVAFVVSIFSGFAGYFLLFKFQIGIIFTCVVLLGTRFWLASLRGYLVFCRLPNFTGLVLHAWNSPSGWPRWGFLFSDGYRFIPAWSCTLVFAFWFDPVGLCGLLKATKFYRPGLARLAFDLCLAPLGFS